MEEKNNNFYSRFKAYRTVWKMDVNDSGINIKLDEKCEFVVNEKREELRKLLIKKFFELNNYFDPSISLNPDDLKKPAENYEKHFLKELNLFNFMKSELLRIISSFDFNFSLEIKVDVTLDLFTKFLISREHREEIQLDITEEKKYAKTQLEKLKISSHIFLGSLISKVVDFKFKIASKIDVIFKSSRR
jgi:hypothetical protein